MRTFLDALDRSNVDCRELSGTNWAGRSPLLGSIVKCRPKSLSELLHLFPSFAAKPGALLDQNRTASPKIVASSPVKHMDTKITQLQHTEVSIHRLLKIQKHLHIPCVGYLNIVLHHNTRYNAATTVPGCCRRTCRKGAYNFYVPPETTPSVKIQRQMHIQKHMIAHKQRKEQEDARPHGWGSPPRFGWSKKTICWV
jgi:hypothetical protein